MAILWRRRGRLLLRRPLPSPCVACPAVCQSLRSPPGRQGRPRPRAAAVRAALGGPGRSLPGLAATMSSFSESALEKKLSELSNSQQSVQTLSLWLIHHRKHAGPIVSVWHRELRKGKHRPPACWGPPRLSSLPPTPHPPTPPLRRPPLASSLGRAFQARTSQGASEVGDRQCCPHFSEEETEAQFRFRGLV